MSSGEWAAWEADQLLCVKLAIIKSGSHRFCGDGLNIVDGFSIVFFAVISSFPSLKLKSRFHELFTPIVLCKPRLMCPHYNVWSTR